MIKYVESQDKTAWYTFYHELPETGFDEKVRNRQGYVCVRDRKIIGILRYNLFWDSIPFCSLLFIREDRQRKGYGRVLTAHWEKAMKDLGFGLVMTSTQSDENAQHFYRSLGYRDCGALALPFPGYEQPLEIIMAKQP